MTMKFSVMVCLVLGAMGAQAADGGGVDKQEAAFTKKECLNILRKQADHGDGNAAKVLAIYYGTDSRNDALSLAFLKEAIAHGMDVSDVPKMKTANVMEVCKKDPALQAGLAARKPVEAPKKEVEKPKKPVEVAKKPPEPAKPTAESARAPVVAVAAAKSPEKAAPPSAPAAEQAAPASKLGGAPATKPVEVAVAVQPARPKPANLEFERMAADAEWGGKVSEALKYWEKAREAGSRAAAKRLYQIYSFGAGDVEPDYVKAIEASQIAAKMGLEVPPLPRK